ncbi:c2h2 type zinc finger domain protein [Diplodia corticola]|uniref:C2h2 type zinc finger domain protein n=1 Tax=Diplodia corticola TaxID=236234 RepID=A0A1J9R989_9PEZI|nr:c2h2 type zinc finger domain protein [Diplodia corticola]OJD38110.1 c2h2 type zinc finger domain protein [Diplodia corticola]
MPSRMSTSYYYNEADLAMMDMFPGSTCQPASSAMYAPCQMQQLAPRQMLDTRPHPIAMNGYVPHQQSPGLPAHGSFQQHEYWTPQHSMAPQPSLAVPSLPPYATPTMAYAQPPQAMTPESTLPSSYTLVPRGSRSPSASTGAFSPQPSVDGSVAEYSRSISPSANSADLRAYGYLNKNGTWTCAYPGCTSKAVFTRGCDLRKHHKRHTKSFFCRHEGCPQATGGGFSSKKDLARHEAKHNPGVVCEWDGCERIFSRVDNMRDHVKRIHLKGARPAAGKRTTTA